ncbi:hypothetical protein G4228_019437 [Cervus hanglu yarkandensis]|nr:hypothetical protein G4228_019437 [Cervus hanglu yarkandensis]
MKSFSPVRSVRKNSLSDHGLGISRSKTPVDDPMSLLYNMDDCYSKLKELVPSIPPNKKVSKMEILQHVIDYILDLQIALDSHPDTELPSSMYEVLHLPDIKFFPNVYALLKVLCILPVMKVENERYENG